MAADFPIIETVAAAVPARRTAGQLSFTCRRLDGGINLWKPGQPAGDWQEQCRVGREYGQEAIDYIRETNDAAMLPSIVQMIAERGTFGGVEVGFFASLSMSLAN